MLCTKNFEKKKPNDCDGKEVRYGKSNYHFFSTGRHRLFNKVTEYVALQMQIEIYIDKKNVILTGSKQ